MPEKATVTTIATIQFKQPKIKKERKTTRWRLWTTTERKKVCKWKKFLAIFLWIWNEFDKVIVYYIGR